MKLHVLIKRERIIYQLLNKTYTIYDNIIIDTNEII